MTNSLLFANMANGGLVRLPTWTMALLDQLNDAEQAAIDTGLRQFANSGDQTLLKLLATADPERQNGTLYEMRIEIGLRILLVQRDEFSHYEVVGIHRYAA